ncbi:glycosyltransferase family 2 protein [Candidatus Parcubacteria bacterium]|nr:glycosyltransferase family 2 protein [Candidatus Parcubacteria bacterium]
MPKITVIITTYNRANILRDAIKSILCQSFQDFELIVVDDCSSDDTENVVRKFRDKRIFYLKHKRNMGDAAAKNTGIRAAQGEYIISLDDDDLMVPWAFEELVKKAGTSKEKDFAGVYAWSWWVYNDGQTLKFTNYQKKGKLFNAILKDQVFTNILFKKKVFEDVGYYDETIKSNYDHDFYLRVAEKYRFDFVPKILFVIRVQKNKHLSRLSLSHMELHQSVTQRFSPRAVKHGVFILRFFPVRFYVGLSVLKHRLITIFKLFLHPELKQQIKKTKEVLKKQGVEL